MKERPILFSAPMVQAILTGRKTQTRRVVRPQPAEDYGAILVGDYHPTVIRREEEEPGPQTFGAFSKDGEWATRCPFGQPGDLLWVRETWRPVGEFKQEIVYRADEDWHANAGWKPSIFMPKWAARIWLEVTGVRVERLQDISEIDATADGGFNPITRDCKRPKFQRLWESINGPESWNANPWVWAISFRRVERAREDV